MKWSYVAIPIAGAALALLLFRKKSGEAVVTPGIPKGRRTQEGYILSEIITANHVPAIRAAGVRLVYSLVALDNSTIDALRRAGITQVTSRVGNTIYPATVAGIEQHLDRGVKPSRVLIHCTHGADRTGALTAVLLARRHRWRLQDALYSVVAPQQQDIDGLVTVLRENGIRDVRSPDDPTVGGYSHRVFGVPLGMKARNEGYRGLVRSTFDVV
jgi:hypothetical protein